MQSRNWSKTFLVASWGPSALLVAYILWYMLIFRRSGQEVWGDGATIFYLGVLAYPLALLLLAIGTYMSFRWHRRHPSTPHRPGVGLVSVVLAARCALFAGPLGEALTMRQSEPLVPQSTWHIQLAMWLRPYAPRRN